MIVVSGWRQIDARIRIESDTIWDCFAIANLHHIHRMDSMIYVFDNKALFAVIESIIRVVSCCDWFVGGVHMEPGDHPVHRCDPASGS